MNLSRAFVSVSVFLAAVGAIGAVDSSSSNTDDDDGRVKIDLYYESQCPGCRNTITNSFKQAYDAQGFLKMAKVTLIPFGNAVEYGDKPPYSFQCQHGETECVYNLIETCALNAIECPYQQFQLINCIENYDHDMKNTQDYDAVLDACALLTGVSKDNLNEITSCYKSDKGNKLEHEMALKTAALKPSHEYVPWIVANGVHNDDIQNQVMESLLDYVCGVYSGPHKSPWCREPSAVVQSHGFEDQLCHRDSDFVSDLQ